MIVLAGCNSTNVTPEKMTLPVPEVNQANTKTAKKPTKTPRKTQQTKSVITRNNVLNMWSRINMQTKLPIPKNQETIKQRLNWYKTHPDYMYKITRRAKPFMQHIILEIEKRNMPLELALLPIIESDFDTKAYSSKGAAGIWQLMPDIARHYNIQRDTWYDGRYDIIAATSAALDYLAFLHKKFNKDWLLAVAAYNSGEGRVVNAIRANRKLGKKTDFWSLSLPKETKDYVPRLLAISAHLKLKKYFGNWPDFENRATTIQIDLGRQFDMLVAAKISQTSMKTLYMLNPGYSGSSSSSNGPHKLLVPIEKAYLFDAHDQLVNGVISHGHYQVVKGDSLYKISKRFNTSIDKLKQLNKLKSSLIKIKQVLKLPGYKPIKLTIDYPISPYIQREKAVKKEKISKKYTIKPGDTLWDISQHYKVPFKEIAIWNKLNINSVLKPGKLLTIWLDKIDKPKIVTENKVSRSLLNNLTHSLNLDSTTANKP